MSFWKDEFGGLYLYFGLAVLPIVCFIGLSIDMSRAYHTRAMIISATDAAAIAAAKVSPEDAQAEARRVFEAYISGTSVEKNAKLDTVIIDEDKGYVQVSGKSDLDLTFLQIIGYKQLPLKGYTRVAKASQTVEVALVLDNTGSMRHNYAGKPRIEHLRDAVSMVLDVFYPDDKPNNHLFVSIVPYITQINVGPRKDWLKLLGKLMVDNPLFFPDKKWGRWQGCLEARLNDDLHISDTPPSDERTRFMPYWWASTLTMTYPLIEGGGKPLWLGKSEGDNDWVPGKRITPWTTTDPVNPNAGCPVEIMPLTNDKKALLERAKEMFPISRGGTFMFVGLKGGFWNLSPKWRDYWHSPNPHKLPKDYKDSKKVMILMADGHNEWIASDGPWNYYRDRHYTSYKRYYGPINSELNQDVLQYTELNDYTLAWCDLVKGAGIEIYTIAFGIWSSQGRATMKACASSTGHYYHADSGSDLHAAFSEIAERVEKLRYAWHEKNDK